MTLKDLERMRTMIFIPKRVKCKVCGKEFKVRTVGRLRVLKKEKVGESVAYVCPKCAVKK